MVSIDTPVSAIVGAVLALLLVLAGLIYAIRKANEVALLLVAATLAYVLPLVAALLPGQLTASFTFYALQGVFPLIAFGLAAFAILQLVKRIKPVSLIVPPPFDPGPPPAEPGPPPYQPGPPPDAPRPDAGPETFDPTRPADPTDPAAGPSDTPKEQ